MRAILIILCLTIVTACTHTHGPPAMYQPVCRHIAIYCALTAGEYCPVRIALGYWDNELHTQAQRHTMEGWQYLGLNLYGQVVPVTLKDFTNITYLSLDDYLWRFEVRMGERWTEIE